MLNLSSRVLRIFYFGTYIWAFILYLLLNGLDLFGDNVTSMYIINLTCILSTLLGCYVAVGKPSFFYNLLSSKSAGNGAKEQHQRWVFTTILIFFGLLSINTIFYCIAAYANAPKYCVLISLVLGLLIYPRTSSPSNSSES